MCCSKGHCLHKPWKVLENFSISLKRPWNDKNVRHCSHLSGELAKGKWSLSKTLSKPEELKTPSFRWDVDQERFENAAFRKRWRHNNHVIYPNPQGGTQEFCRPAIVAFSKFSGPVWTENLWFIFILKRRYQISPAWCVKGVFAIFTSSWPPITLSGYLCRSLPKGYDQLFYIFQFQKNAAISGQ